MLVPGQIIDGYRLVKRAGSGGFGEVWVALLEATSEYRALKFLPEHSPRLLERELNAVIQYRREVANLRCPALVPIEHVNRIEGGLVYTMPLADGLHGGEPTDPGWQPATLAAVIDERRAASRWFSAQEIAFYLHPIIAAASALNQLHIVHRDIKPENILILKGCPHLADISLLARDGSRLSRQGTPGYIAPSWYMESGGNPDMWGLAATLYTLLSGNPADKIGKIAYFWPPQGAKSVHRETWIALHQLTLAATQEAKAERLPDLEAFSQGLATATYTPLPAPAPGHFLIIRGALLLRDLILFSAVTLGGSWVAQLLVQLGYSPPELIGPGLGLLSVFIAYGIIGWLAPHERSRAHLITLTIAAWAIGFTHVLAGTLQLWEWIATLPLLALPLAFARAITAWRQKKRPHPENSSTGK